MATVNVWRTPAAASAAGCCSSLPPVRVRQLVHLLCPGCADPVVAKCDAARAAMAAAGGGLGGARLGALVLLHNGSTNAVHLLYICSTPVAPEQSCTADVEQMWNIFAGRRHPCHTNCSPHLLTSVLLQL